MDNSNNNYVNLYGTSKKDKNVSKRYSKYRNEWINNPENNIISNFPLNVDIELTNACNLRCPHCARTSNNWENKAIGFMDKRLVKKILDEISKEKGYCVKFSLRGEPLLYKNLIDILKYAKNTNLEEFYFNTNGTLLTKELSKQLVDLRLPRISISVGGWNKETFEKSQFNAKFEKVRENIKNLKEYRDSQKSIYPKIRVQVVLIPEVQKNIKKFINLWKDYADELGGIEFRSESKVKNFNVKFNEFKCSFLWQRLVVLWDGTVYPCLFHGVKKADDLILGNAKKDSLKNLWNSSKINRIRRKHLRGESEKIKSCSFCSYRRTIIEKIREKK